MYSVVGQVHALIFFNEMCSSQFSAVCIVEFVRLHTHAHNTQPFNGLWSGKTRVGRYQKKHHPLTPILIIGHPLSSSSIYSDQWHPLCSFYVLDIPLVQPLSRSSLVFLLVLDPQLHTPYISSPNHHLLLQQMPIPTQSVLLQYQCYVIYT